MKYFKYFIFMLFTLLIFNTQNVFAINTGISSSFPTGTFRTNYSGTNINYIRDGLTAASATGDSSKYSVPKDLKNNSGTPLYLLSINKKDGTDDVMLIPTTTESIEIINNENPTSITDKGLTYIITHGYNKTNSNNTIFSKKTYGALTDTTKMQYVTQIALWLYISDKHTSFSTTYCKYDSCVLPSNVRDIINSAASTNDYKYLKYIIDLVTEANNYSGKEESSIKALDNTDIDYHINNNSTLLVTDVITPQSKTNNKNYMYYAIEITDPENYGVYITDSNNNKITNLTNMTGSFKVAVPLKTNIESMNLATIKITVYGYYVYDDIRAYRVTQSPNGLLSGYEPNKKQKYSDLTLGDAPIEIVSTNFDLQNIVKISKIDITDSSELPGATLQIIKKSDNSTVEEFVSTASPHYLYLDNGDYSLCETIPPSGFDLNTECVDFTVDGTSIKAVTMENKPTDIPNTLLNKTNIMYFIGLILIISGIIFMSTLPNNKYIKQ